MHAHIYTVIPSHQECAHRSTQSFFHSILVQIPPHSTPKRDRSHQRNIHRCLKFHAKSISQALQSKTSNTHSAARTVKYVSKACTQNYNLNLSLLASKITTSIFHCLPAKLQPPSFTACHRTTLNSIFPSHVWSCGSQYHITAFAKPTSLQRFTTHEKTLYAHPPFVPQITTSTSDSDHCQETQAQAPPS